MNQELRNFVLAVLDDDHGIKEDAWYQLCDFLQGTGEFELLGELSAQIDSCDGRYFLSIPVDSQDVPVANEKCPVCGVARESGDAPHLGFRCGCWQQ